MLQHLVRDASRRHIVCVSSGVHQGTVVLSKPLSLVSAGRAAIEGDGDSALVVTGDSDVLIEGLVLRNSSAYSGGGVFLAGSGEITLRNCTFLGNRALGYGGGALYVEKGRVILERCRFVGNVARLGGAILAENDATVSCVGCLFEENTAQEGAWVCALDGADVQLTHCTFSSSHTESVLFCRGSSTRAPRLELINSIVDTPGPVATLVSGGATPSTRIANSVLPRTPAAPVETQSCIDATPRYRRGDVLQGLAPDSPGVGLADGSSPSGAVDYYGAPLDRTGLNPGAVTRPPDDF